MDGSKRSLVRPSWIDSLSMLAISEAVFSEFTLVAGVTQLILPNNPLRWGFLIVGSPMAAIGLLISPNNRPDLFSIEINLVSADRYFTIFTHGPLLPSEWYANHTAGGSFGIYEYILQDWSDNESSLVES